MDQILTRAVELAVLALGGVFSLIYNQQRRTEQELFDRLREAELAIQRLETKVEDAR